MKKLLIFSLLIGLNSIAMSQEYFIVKDSLNKYNFIDKTNKKILNKTFTSIKGCGDFFIITDSLNNEGVLNKQLTEILPSIFQDINPTCKSWIYAKKNDKYGFYDSLGNQITPHIYDEVYSFLNDSSLVLLKETNEVKLIWIGQKGNIIREGKIEEKGLQNHCTWSYKLTSTPNGLKKKKRKVGILINSKWIINPIYDNIEYTAEGNYIVSKKSLKGLHDKNGKLIVPLKYHQIIEMKR